MSHKIANLSSFGSLSVVYGIFFIGTAIFNMYWTQLSDFQVNYFIVQLDLVMIQKSDLVTFFTR